MTPKDFLELIWPSTGYYCLAIPYKTAKMKTPVFTHKVFETIEAAADYVEGQKQKSDIYYAIHTLKEKELFNPHKRVNGKKELGGMEVRVQRNSKEAKCLFFDIDIGEKEGKYSSIEEAKQEVAAFVKTIKLPDPTIVCSGNGLHIYWHLTQSVASSEWRNLAAKLRRLAEHLGLKIDPSRTVDTASILRVLATYNHKNPNNLKLVTLEQGPGPAHDYEDYMKIMDDAIEVHAPAQIYLPRIEAKTELNLTDQLGNNTQDYYIAAPPPSLEAMLKVCEQFRNLKTANGKVSYKRWYHGTLQLGRFVENGRQVCHEMSMGHESYSAEETDKYLDYLEANKIGPTTCAFMADLGGRDICERCNFKQKTSPLVAARRITEAPAPIAMIRDENGYEKELAEGMLIKPPHPYKRTTNKTIIIESNDPKVEEEVICTYDLYPMMRIANVEAGKEQHLWRVVLPRDITRDFILDAEVLYDTQKFQSIMPNLGIHYCQENQKKLKKYMTAYIRALQDHADAQKQCTHLGWADGQTKFITTKGVLDLNGAFQNHILSPDVQAASMAAHSKGEMQKQIALMEFYNRPEYVTHQFFILCALAAPLMIFTNQHGVCVNASGESGASKSSSLYTGASFWGHPEKYPFNGTPAGSTTLGRATKMRLLGTYPICVDEITHIEVQEAHNMVMNLTQPNNQRDKLGPDGKPKFRTQIEDISTIMLTTANTSLHAILSATNSSGTAASMRIVELQFIPQLVHTKQEADAYMFALKENYGHIGPEFMSMVMKNKVAVGNRVRKVLGDVDATVGAAGCERFWSATAASVFVTLEIAHAQGLLPYSLSFLKEWYLKRQIPKMRTVVQTEYSSSVSILGAYVNEIHPNTIQVRAVKGALNQANVVTKPTQALKAHHDLDAQELWVELKSFKDYCTKRGANMTKILEELSEAKPVNGQLRCFVTNTKIRKTLGAYTEYARVQVPCFIMDLSHPDATGVISEALPDPDVVPPSNVVALNKKA